MNVKILILCWWCLGIGCTFECMNNLMTPSFMYKLHIQNVSKRYCKKFNKSNKLGTGERYDVVIEANQPIDVYYILVRGLTSCSNTSQLAVLQYRGSILPTSLPSYDSIPSNATAYVRILSFIFLFHNIFIQHSSTYIYTNMWCHLQW